MLTVVATIIAQVADPVRIALMGIGVIGMTRGTNLSTQVGITALLSFFAALFIYMVLSSMRIAGDPLSIMSLGLGVVSSFLVGLAFIALVRAVRWIF